MELIHEYKGFRCFKVCAGERYCDLYQYLRTQTYDRPGWQDIQKGSLDQDRFDTNAIYSVVVSASGDLIGGFRFIQSERANELPVAAHCDMNRVQSRIGIPMEISRWCTDDRFDVLERAKAS